MGEKAALAELKTVDGMIFGDWDIYFKRLIIIYFMKILLCFLVLGLVCLADVNPPVWAE